MAKISMIDSSKCSQRCWELQFSYIPEGNIKSYKYFGKQLTVSYKTQHANTMCNYIPAIVHLGIDLREKKTYVHTNPERVKQLY